MNLLRSGLVLVLLGSSFTCCTCFGQQSKVADFAPKNAIALARIGNVKEVLDIVEELSGLFFDERMVDVLVSEPFPLIEKEKLDLLQTNVNSLLEELREVKSVTAYLTSIDPVAHSTWIIEFQDPTETLSADKVSEFFHLIVAMANRLADADTKGAYHQILAEISKKLLHQGLLELEFKRVDKFLVLSTDPEQTRNITNQISNENSNSGMLAQRKFKIIENKMDFEQESPEIARIYFDPHPFQGIRYPNLSEKSRKLYGLEEIVSGGISISLNSEPKDNDVRIVYRQIQHFTSPPTGSPLVWLASKPIEKIPAFPSTVLNQAREAVGEEPIWSPRKLTISNRDPTLYYQRAEVAYNQANEVDYIDYLDQQGSSLGGASAILKKNNGTEAIYDFVKDGRNSLMIFDGIYGDENWGVDYLKALVKNENAHNDFPIEKLELCGFQAWYMTDENATKSYMFNFDVPRLVAESLPPERLKIPAIVVSDRWLIQGRKHILEEYLKGDFESVAVADELDSLVPGLGKLIKEIKPSKIAVTWGGSRISTGTIRRNYLIQQMGSRDGSKEYLRLIKEKLPHIEIKSVQDRVFCAIELFAKRVNSIAGVGVTLKKVEGNSTELHWLLF